MTFEFTFFPLISLSLSKLETVINVTCLRHATGSLTYHRGAAFFSEDRDNDGNSSGKCPLDRQGVWW